MNGVKVCDGGEPVSDLRRRLLHRDAATAHWATGLVKWQQNHVVWYARVFSIELEELTPAMAEHLLTHESPRDVCRRAREFTARELGVAHDQLFPGADAHAESLFGPA